jgi:uncharacterized protein (DUF58 family)
MVPMKEIIKKLRKYEIRIRKAITAQMQGDFHSIFKGSGLEFDDVRAYQYGDDVRTIDWNVSAKGHGTFVKTFKEEKEQTVYFLLDISASQEIGPEQRQKVDVGKEICGVLTFSSVKENSQVGLLCFSDQRERYIKPGKGIKHAYELILTLFKSESSSRKTDISRAIAFALNLIKRRSVVVLISDFIDSGYEHKFIALAKKHDLVVIHLYDPIETSLPSLGIVPLFDQESGKRIWVNTSSKRYREGLNHSFEENRTYLEELCRKYRASYVSVNTREDYVPGLIKLFKVRNTERKSA